MNSHCCSPRTPVSPPRRSFAIIGSAAAKLLPESTLDQDEHDNGRDRHERNHGVHQTRPPPAGPDNAVRRRGRPGQGCIAALATRLSQVEARCGGHPEPGLWHAIVSRRNARPDSTVIGRDFLSRRLVIRLDPAVSHKLCRMTRRKITLLVQTKRVLVPALQEVLIHVAIIAPKDRPWP